MERVQGQWYVRESAWIRGTKESRRGRRMDFIVVVQGEQETLRSTVIRESINRVAWFIAGVVVRFILRRASQFIPVTVCR